MQKSYLISMRTHFKIVGTEVVGISAFLLAILGLQAKAEHGLGPLFSFSWDYLIIGITLILVGFEILSLVNHVSEKSKL